MKHKFVINDESIVNEYGYRIMTGGIDTEQFMRNPIVLFMHNRAWNDASNVIGRVIDLSKQGGQLIAEIEFDQEDEFSKKVSGKVDRGFIRMTSIGADVKESSDKTEDVLPNQLYETVTKSKLTEVSIVDIGANDNALKLTQNGQTIQLKKLESNINKMDTKTIALALGLDAETKEEKLLDEISALKLSRKDAEKKIDELKKTISDTQNEESEILVDKAISLSLIPEGLKASQIKAFENDFAGQKAVLSKLISEAETSQETEGKHQGLKEVILNGSQKGKSSFELSFDYLQKNDVKELGRIRDEEPKKYVQLAKDYANGKRYKEQ